IECKKNVEPDWDYGTKEAMKWDMAFQLFQKGFIELAPLKIRQVVGKVTSLSENYIFIWKYYKPFWSWFILIFRIFSLNPPYKEAKAFLTALKIKRKNIYEQVIIYNEYDEISIKSELLEPKVS